MTLVTFGLAEVLLRVVYAVRNARAETIALPYGIGHDYGPSPPWVDGLRILEPDEALIWRMRPNARRRYLDVFTPARSEADRIAIYRRFWPRPPEELRRHPAWEIALNAHGFRTHEVTVPKPPSRVRVVCLGDSWTFGANVGHADSYPGRLEALLREAFPGRDIEVLNLGVLGYSSFQGRELLRRFAFGLDPDVLVLGFGMNDSSVAGFRDEEVIRTSAPAGPPRLAAIAGASELFRLLRYVALAIRHTPTSIAEHLTTARARAEWLTTAAPMADEYAKLASWTRVPLASYEHNLADMIAQARRRGAGVVLLFNELWEGNPYREAARRVANGSGVPFVDTPHVVARARQRTEADIERTLGLHAHSIPEHLPGTDVEVVFRVSANGHDVPRAIFIAAAHPALGDLVPNRVALHDDGTHGDERAGDGVWSSTARFAPGTRLAYVYTNSGREGQWEGLDVPALRELAVEPPGGRRVYRPIESFGAILMQADSWHTDARGYELIAREVLEAVRQNAHLGARERIR